MPDERQKKPGRKRAGVGQRRKTARVDIPQKPPTAKGARSRANLKAAALRALEDKGYRALRLTDIAREADVNISLVYHYFRDKAHLVFEALRDLVDMGKVLTDEDDHRPDPFDALLHANRVFAEFYRDHPGLMRAIVHFDEEHPEFHELYEKANADWMARIAGNIVKRYPYARLTEREAIAVAYALGGMVDKFLFERYVERVPELVEAFGTIDDCARFLAILWYRALYLENPPPDRITGYEKLTGLSAR